MAYLAREIPLFSRAMRAIFPVFAIWKSWRILAFSKSKIERVMDIGRFHSHFGFPISDFSHRGLSAMRDDSLDETLDETDAEAGEDNGPDQEVHDRQAVPAVILGRRLRRALRAHGIDPHEPSETGDEYDDQPSPPLVLEQACDVAPVETPWLWPWRIPHRRLTILAGQPRDLASEVAFDIVARVSRGTCWPDQPGGPLGNLSGNELAGQGLAGQGLAVREPADSELSGGPPSGGNDGDTPVTRGEPEIVPAVGNVLVISANDAIAETVVPGLLRARADMERVYCLSGVFHRPRRRSSKWTRAFRLAEDYRSLRRAIREMAPLSLLVIDPIEALLHDSNIGCGPRIAEGIVAGLVELARECDVAIVGVAELRREGGRGGMGMALRHPALAHGAQAAWGIARCPEMAGRHVMVPIRMAVGSPAPALEFAVGEGGLEWSSAPAIVAAEDAAVAAHEGLAVAAAMTWLRNLLAPGARLASEVKELARQAGLSRTLLLRVRNEIGVRSAKSGWGSKAYWSLPAVAETAGSEPNHEKVRAIDGDPAPLSDPRGILNGAEEETAPRN
jgi:hypothetical protein